MFAFIVVLMIFTAALALHMLPFRFAVAEVKSFFRRVRPSKDRPETRDMVPEKPAHPLVPIELRYGSPKGDSEVSYWETNDGKGAPFIAAHFPNGGSFYGHAVPVDGYAILAEDNAEHRATVAGLAAMAPANNRDDDMVTILNGRLFRRAFRMASAVAILSDYRKMAPAVQHTIVDGRTHYSDRDMEAIADEFELKDAADSKPSV
jgi:hypothetical protein